MSALSALSDSEFYGLAKPMDGVSGGSISPRLRFAANDPRYEDDQAAEAAGPKILSPVGLTSANARVARQAVPEKPVGLTSEDLAVNNVGYALGTQQTLASDTRDQRLANIVVKNVLAGLDPEEDEKPKDERLKDESKDDPLTVRHKPAALPSYIYHHNRRRSSFRRGTKRKPGEEGAPREGEPHSEGEHLREGSMHGEPHLGADAAKMEAKLAERVELKEAAKVATKALGRAGAKFGARGAFAVAATMVGLAPVAFGVVAGVAIAVVGTIAVDAAFNAFDVYSKGQPITFGNTVGKVFTDAATGIKNEALDVWGQAKEGNVVGVLKSVGKSLFNAVDSVFLCGVVGATVDLIETKDLGRFGNWLGRGIPGYVANAATLYGHRREVGQAGSILADVAQSGDKDAQRILAGTAVATLKAARSGQDLVAAASDVALQGAGDVVSRDGLMGAVHKGQGNEHLKSAFDKTKTWLSMRGQQGWSGFGALPSSPSMLGSLGKGFAKAKSALDEYVGEPLRHIIGAEPNHPELTPA